MLLVLYKNNLFNVNFITLHWGRFNNIEVDSINTVQVTLLKHKCKERQSLKNKIIISNINKNSTILTDLKLPSLLSRCNYF